MPFPRKRHLGLGDDAGRQQLGHGGVVVPVLGEDLPGVLHRAGPPATGTGVPLRLNRGVTAGCGKGLPSSGA